MFALIYIAKPTESPFKIVISALKSLVTNYQFFITVVFMLGILMINKIELSVENNLKEVLNWNFTPLVHNLEGDLVAYIQQFNYYPLTFFLTFMYIIIFPAIVWSCLAIYKYYNDEKMIRALFLGFILNYLIAIPFYLLVPVNESWYGNPKVAFLIHSIYPAFSEQYRPLSGLNNCFPSLHTSISMTIALIAMRSSHKNLARLSLFCAGTIAFSTLYLGIHWFLDVTGGLLLAILISKLALRFSESGILIPEPSISLKTAIRTSLELVKVSFTLIKDSITNRINNRLEWINRHKEW
jgi:membrane-associated phospholipid phosphatase